MTTTLETAQLGVKIIPGDGWYVLEVKIATSDGVVTTSSLKELENEEITDQIEAIPYANGLIINGRMPIWLNAYFVGKAIAHNFIACNDPRLGGAVVVEHGQNCKYQLGEIIKWQF